MGCGSSSSPSDTTAADIDPEILRKTEAMLAKNAKQIGSLDSQGAVKPVPLHARSMSFVGKEGLEDMGKVGPVQTNDIFNMFKLQHVMHTDEVLFPVDPRPIGPLTAKRANRALGLMSAASLSRGKRPYMEDLVCNIPVVADELEGFEERPQSCFFGVFDGHGGSNGKVGDEVAHYLAEMLVVRFFEAYVESLQQAVAKAAELDASLSVVTAGPSEQGSGVGTIHADGRPSQYFLGKPLQNSPLLGTGHAVRISRKLSSDFVVGLTTPKLGERAATPPAGLASAAAVRRVLPGGASSGSQSMSALVPATQRLAPLSLPTGQSSSMMTPVTTRAPVTPTLGAGSFFGGEGKRNLPADPDLRDLFTRVFLDFEDEIQTFHFLETAGSTCTVATIIGDALVVANIGDSDAILCRKGVPHMLSYQHKASDPAEQQRIIASGGTVFMNFGSYRVSGMLELSRDFGSTMMKRDCSALTPEPHVAVVELCEDDEFLIIGSDGLFEVYSNHRQLVKTVKETLRATGSVDETARNIVRDVVRSINSNDNVSLVLVVFNQFGVITSHAGAAGGWRGFAAASKPVLVAPESMRSPPCPLPPIGLVSGVAGVDAAMPLPTFRAPVSTAGSAPHDKESAANKPVPAKPIVNQHLALVGHAVNGTVGSPIVHAPSPLRTVAATADAGAGAEGKENAPTSSAADVGALAKSQLAPSGSSRDDLMGTGLSDAVLAESMAVEHVDLGIEVPAM